ncbi:MAG: MarR family transcriptional regulator [Nitratireductor sp.]|nr:MarR family transcriptional regulator [Nitratireductor sp.]
MKADADATSQIVVEPITESEIPQIANIELIFFAYRDFTADADRILSRFGFGRAHHRALYFVNRKPGMTVADLISILAITKQSLSRVLRQLIDAGHIRQIEGREDRRQRRLFPTQSGRELVLELSRPQSRRIDAAMRESGLSADTLVADFMKNMINPQERAVLANLSSKEG